MPQNLSVPDSIRGNAAFDELRMGLYRRAAALVRPSFAAEHPKDQFQEGIKGELARVPEVIQWLDSKDMRARFQALTADYRTA